jgi:hypothetical protein
MKNVYLILFSILLYSCGSGSSSSTGEWPKSQKISKEQFGDKWPLTVDAGTVVCVDGASVIFVADNRSKYAVNGTAKSKKRMQENGWLDIGEIWKKDPELPGASMDIRPILDAGVALCNGK